MKDNTTRNMFIGMAFIVAMFVFVYLLCRQTTQASHQPQERSYLTTPVENPSRGR